MFIKHTCPFSAIDVIGCEVVTVRAGTEQVTVDTADADVRADVIFADVDACGLSVLVEHVHYLRGFQLSRDMTKLGKFSLGH